MWEMTCSKRPLQDSKRGYRGSWLSQGEPCTNTSLLNLCLSTNLSVTLTTATGCPQHAVCSSPSILHKVSEVIHPSCSPFFLSLVSSRVAGNAQVAHGSNERSDPLAIQRGLRSCGPVGFKRFLLVGTLIKAPTSC